MRRKLKNAGIQSVQEAVTRLLSREVFYSQGFTIMYSDLTKKFLLINTKTGAEQPLSFKGIKSWEKEVPWFAGTLPENGVLCAVYNSGNSGLQSIVAITDYDANAAKPFKTKLNAYTNAIPLSKSDIEKFYLNED